MLLPNFHRELRLKIWTSLANKNMTSNERKIVKCLWEAKGKAHIPLIARETGFTQDYARMLGRSLERARYIRFTDMNLCHLLTKGRARFQDNAPLHDSSPEVVVASVAAPAISVGDDIAEDSAPKEEEDSLPASFATATDDSDLDKALAEAGVSYPFQKNEEVAETETSPQRIEETSSTAGPESPANGEETIGIEPQAVAEVEKKEPEVFQTAEPAQAVSVEPPQFAEEKIAENPVSVASSPARQSLGEGGESPEKVAPKEESAKPSGSVWSFKKIANWFAEKK